MFYGFDYGPSTGGWTRFYPGHGRPETFEGGNFDSLQQNTYIRRNSTTTFRKSFGLPDKIISDRGPQFASKVFIELLKLLGIKSALSTAYHPQIDGTTE